MDGAFLIPAVCVGLLGIVAFWWLRSKEEGSSRRSTARASTNDERVEAAESQPRVAQPACAAAAAQGSATTRGRQGKTSPSLLTGDRGKGGEDGDALSDGQSPLVVSPTEGATLRLQKGLLDRLGACCAAAPAPAEGWLVGRGAFVASFVCERRTGTGASPRTGAGRGERAALAALLPGGLDVVGAFTTADDISEASVTAAATRRSGTCGATLVAVSTLPCGAVRLLRVTRGSAGVVVIDITAACETANFADDSGAVMLRCRLWCVAGAASLELQASLGGADAAFVVPGGRVVYARQNGNGDDENETVRAALGLDCGVEKEPNAGRVSCGGGAVATGTGNAEVSDAKKVKRKPKGQRKGKGKAKGKKKKGGGKKRGGGRGTMNLLDAAEAAAKAETDQAAATADAGLTQTCRRGIPPMVTVTHVCGPGAGTAAAPPAVFGGGAGRDSVGAPLVLFADVGCYVDSEQPLATALAALGDAGAAQLRRLSRLCDGAVNGDLAHPAAFLFDLHTFGIPHAVAAAYCLADPRKSNAAREISAADVGLHCREANRPDLVAQRTSLHARLGLPADRPLVRSWCGLPGGLGPDEGGPCPQRRLKNVHGSIPEGLLPGRGFDRCVVVRGDYEYYHYLQDGIDDKGWGCAYRSLQTILSWFRLNNYTRAPIPMHRQIQSILVAAKDKPASFVGSRTWIGGTEIARVLESILPDVTCRMIRTATGPAIADHARELQNHFATEGTPVMIGGGALAFTLLGVAFNTATGACRFLILDPHYCGDDIVGIVTSKEVPLMGYTGFPCGWREASTFARSPYSLCLPRCPKHA